MRVTQKISTLDQLSQCIAKEKEHGHRIVLSHGTFDLLHIGHIHHFQEAKSHGDILVVTITADQYILKGPDRPVFNQSDRLSMIAALDLVDYVAVVDDKSALPAISSVQPDFYVKGPDYADENQDVTGKIKSERLLTESFGGKFVTTQSPTHSSSTLLNRHLSNRSIDLKEKLHHINEKGGIKLFQEYFRKMQDLSVLFVGETIIDQYCYVDVLGKPEKEINIAVQYKDEEKFAGGVIAAANHVSELCGDVRVLTTIGMEAPQLDVIEDSLAENVTLLPFEVPDIPTVCKKRYIDRDKKRKMFEVYHMNDQPLTEETENNFLNLLKTEIEKVDIVIVFDFGHGMITRRAVELLEKNAKFLAVNVQTNTGNRGYNLVQKYSKSHYTCLDELEFRLASHDKFSDIQELVTKRFGEITGAKQGVVTYGAKGCLVYGKNDSVYYLPALSSGSVDTMGAGDAFFSVTAPLAALGAMSDEIALVGNAAGSQMVNIMGHKAHIERIKLEKHIETILK